MLIYNDQAVGLQVPPTVELTITSAIRPVHGNSATGRTEARHARDRSRRTRARVFSTGETIKVDSRTGQFLSRA